MSKRDCYEVLGVGRSADEETIKKAYRRMAMRYHPDRNQEEESPEQFKEAKEAYEILSNRERRATYDQTGHAGVEGMGGWDDGGFANIFDDMLNDGFEKMATHEQVYRGKDIAYTVEVTLEEAITGARKEVRFSAEKVCGHCAGSGAKAGTTPMQCTQCKGQGKTRKQQGFFSVEEKCDRCAGTGTYIKEQCQECAGNGTLVGEKKVRVKIPAGIDDGQRIRCAGEGNPSKKGGQTGDLYIDVKIVDHATFTRCGLDLECTMPVRMTTATLGGKVKIQTLGTPMQVRVPAGTQGGTKFRIRGKGVTNNRGEGPGDLVCTIKVLIPAEVNEEERTLLEQLDGCLRKREDA